MRNALFYLLPVFLVIATIAYGAGTVTVTEHNLGISKRVIFNWVSDATGDVTITSTDTAYTGKISHFITTPSIAPASPDANYDITLKNQYGIDVLRGLGANRSDTNTEIVQSSTFIPLVGDKLNIAVSNAGGAHSGTAFLYIQPN